MTYMLKYHIKDDETVVNPKGKADVTPFNKAYYNLRALV